jgi:hypothetical protein
MLERLAAAPWSWGLSEWRFIAFWTLAAELPWAVDSLLSRVAHLHLFPLFLIAIEAVAQWAVLRARLPRAGWWVPLSLLGPLVVLAVGTVALTVLVEALGIPLREVAKALPLEETAVLGGQDAAVGLSRFATLAVLIVGTVLVGASPALGQWLFLRRRVQAAGWWVASNVAVAGVAGLWTGIAHPSGAANEALTGIVGAFVLTRLLRSPVGPSRPPPSRLRSVRKEVRRVGHRR